MSYSATGIQPKFTVTDETGALLTCPPNTNTSSSSNNLSGPLLDVRGTSSNPQGGNISNDLTHLMDDVAKGATKKVLNDLGLLENDVEAEVKKDANIVYNWYSHLTLANALKLLIAIIIGFIVFKMIESVIAALIIPAVLIGLVYLYSRYAPAGVPALS